MTERYRVIYEEVIQHEFEIRSCEEGDIVERFQCERDSGDLDFSDGTLVSGQLIRAYDKQGNAISLAMSHADLEAAYFAEKEGGTV